MTPEEAYEKLQIGKMPMQVMDCLDFGDFYAYYRRSGCVPRSKKTVC